MLPIEHCNELGNAPMKLKLIKTSLIAASLAAVPLASAKVETFSLGFVTIQDISITQQQALTFGQNIVGSAATTCTLHIAVTGTGTGLAASADVDDGLVGSGCLTLGGGASPTTVNNLAGIYHISGEADQTVEITVGAVSTSNFSFTPSGKLVTQGDALNIAGNQVNVLGTSTTNDVLGSAGNSGLSLVLGGTLTVGGTDLTSNTPYSSTFNITATY